MERPLRVPLACKLDAIKPHITRIPIDVEIDIYQGRPAQVAGHIELLDDAPKRGLEVIVGIQHVLFHRRQALQKARLHIEPRANSARLDALYHYTSLSSPGLTGERLI